MQECVHGHCSTQYYTDGDNASPMLVPHHHHPINHKYCTQVSTGFGTIVSRYPPFLAQASDIGYPSFLALLGIHLFWHHLETQMTDVCYPPFLAQTLDICYPSFLAFLVIHRFWHYRNQMSIVFGTIGHLLSTVFGKKTADIGYSSFLAFLGIHRF